MTCAEFRAHLGAYVDGELEVRETAAADAHAAECHGCRGLVAAQGQLRDLLRRQPRETAPSELRARIIRGIHRRALVPLIPPGLAAAAMALLVLVGALLALPRAEVSVAERLVDTHSAYVHLEQPAEFVSTTPADVHDWFVTRAGLGVPVPDYSAAGIHLVGGRVVALGERRGAHVFYGKGHTLLSVFVVPVGARDTAVNGARTRHRGHEYLTRHRGVYRTVLWTEGPAGRQVIFGLVSMLDWDAMLECADTLRAEWETARRS